MDTVPDLERHVGFWLRRVSNHVSGAFRERLAARGVTVAEWVALRALLGSGPCSLQALAADIGVDPSTASRLVERLLRKDLAARTESDGDRRRVRLELTRAGRALVPRLAREADANDARFFGHLPKSEAAALLKTLRGLVDKHGWKDKPTE